MQLRAVVGVQCPGHTIRGQNAQMFVEHCVCGAFTNQTGPVVTAATCLYAAQTTGADHYETMRIRLDLPCWGTCETATTECCWGVPTQDGWRVRVPTAAEAFHCLSSPPSLSDTHTIPCVSVRACATLQSLEKGLGRFQLSLHKQVHIQVSPLEQNYQGTSIKL
jgi:hypothetical protein